MKWLFSCVVFPLLVVACAPVYSKNTDVNVLGDLSGKEVWKIEASLPSGLWSYVVASEPLEQLLKPEHFYLRKIYSNMDLMEETMDTRLLRDLGDREIVLYARRDVGATITKVTFRLRKKTSGPFNLAEVSWGYSCEVLYDPASPDWKVFGRLKGTFTDSSEPTMQGNMLLPGDKSACEVTRVQP